MDFYQEGDSIEFLKSEIIAKKFNRGRPKRHPINKKRYFFLKVDRSGSAETLKELNPKKPIIDPDSKINISDKICGDKLDMFIDCKKRPKQQKIGGHTGSHGSNIIITEDYTYAKISKRYDTIPFIPDSKPRVE